MVIEYKCNLCNLHFATKNLYKQHLKTYKILLFSCWLFSHPSGNSLQEISSAKSDKENINPNNTSSYIPLLPTNLIASKLDIPEFKHLYIKSTHSVGSESTNTGSTGSESTKSAFFHPGTSAKPLIEVYFRDSRIADGV